MATREANHLLPTSDVALDVGSTAARWRTAYARELRALGTPAGTEGQVTAYSQSDTARAQVLFNRARDNAGALEAVATGDSLGEIGFYGYDGAAYSQGAFIRSPTDGTIASGRMPARIEFGTAPDAVSAPTARWRIMPDGSLIPSGAMDIGLAGTRVEDIFVNNVDVGVVARPDADLGADLGASALRFAAAYLRDLRWSGARLPYVFHGGTIAADNTAMTLALVSGGNGGAVALPMILAAPMVLQGYSLLGADTANARSCEMRLYQDIGGTNSLAFVTGTDATLSFTPSAIVVRTASVSGAPVTLWPGTYYLVIRNTSTAQTFGIRQMQPVGNWPAGTPSINRSLSTVAALGATIDTSTWTQNGGIVSARLNGRIGNESAAY